MFRTALAAAALAAISVPALASPQLLGYVGQVRAQATVVRAQADAAFAHCPRGRLIADDIYDELDDLCRDLERLEEHLSRPILSQRGVRRLERLVHRLDDQACEVEEAVREALADARRRASFGHSHPPAFAPAPTNHFVGHRGVSVSVGGGRFRFSFGQPVVTHVSQRVIPAPVLTGGVPGPVEAALCHQTSRLRLMTQQLQAIVCG